MPCGLEIADESESNSPGAMESGACPVALHEGQRWCTLLGDTADPFGKLCLFRAIRECVAE